MVFDFFRGYLFSKRAGSLIKTISLISLLGAMLSTAALVVVISVMQGFGSGIRDRLLDVEPHIVVNLPENVRTVSESEFIAQSLQKRIPQSEVRLFETQDLMIRTVDGLHGGAIGNGILPGTLKRILTDLDNAKKKKKPGQLVLDRTEVSEETYTLKKGEVVIGVDLANSLAVFEDQELTIISPESLLLPPGELPKYEKVRVKAILRSNVPQIDSQILFYGLGETLSQISYTKPKNKTLEIRLQNPVDLGAAIEILQNDGFNYSTWKTRNSSLFYSVKLEKILMTTFLSLTLLIGSFSVVTLLALLTTQKRTDIGMLRSLGLSRTDIRKMFTSFGFLLTLLGTTIGAFIGVAICVFLKTTTLIKLPSIYYDTTLPVELDYPTVLIVMIILLMISLLASWFSAKNASEKTPVESLRFR